MFDGQGGIDIVGVQGSSDADLVASTRAGDAHAFTQLVERYHGAVFATARGYTQQREIAEEIAQEAFLRAFLKLETLERPEYFPVWAHRIARNLAMDWLRSGKRKSELINMVPFESGTLPELSDENTPSPRDAVAAREQKEQITAAINRLPTDLRETVLLHFAEGFTNAEIARRMGVDRSSVGRKLQKALHLLKREFGAKLDSAARVEARPNAASSNKAVALIMAAAVVSTEVRSALAAASADTPIGSTAQPAVNPLSVVSWKTAAFAGLTIVVALVVFMANMISQNRSALVGPAGKLVISGSNSRVTPLITGSQKDRPQLMKQHRGSPAPAAGVEKASKQRRTISGVVVDPEGNPVSDVTVEITGTIHEGRPNDKTVPPPRPGTTSTLYQDTTNLSAVSDRSGRFVVPAQPDDTLNYGSGQSHRILGYVIRFSPPEPEQVDVRVSRVLSVKLVYHVPPDTHNLHVVLSPGGSISGRVLYADETGTTKPVAGVHLFADSSRDAWHCVAWQPRHAITDANGSYRISGLSHELYTHMDGKAHRWVPRDWIVTCEARSKTVPVAENSETTNVDFLVKDADPGPGEEWRVTGQVFDASTSRPLTECNIQYRTGSDAEWGGWLDANKTGDQVSQYIALGEAGKLMQLKVEAPGFTPTLSPVFRNPSTYDFYLQPSIGLRGIVIGADHAPVAGAKVGVYWDIPPQVSFRNGVGP